MRTLSILFLATALVGQQQATGDRTPREPSLGDAVKTAGVPTPHDAPVTTTVAPLMLAAEKPVPAAIRHAISTAADHAVRFDQPTGGGPLWALGANYKASFEPTQWHYIARPTAAATRLQPLTFRLASARVGQTAIDTGATDGVEHAGNRVLLRHGNVLEGLELGPTAIEQTFTFATLPQRGELVLAIDLASELAGQQDGDGLRFTSEWLDVGYTGAVAIDAHGNRTAAATTLVDGHIEIRVPAPFVETAALPLVIDPVVSSGIVINNNLDVGNPDVVYAANSGEWHAVYQRLFAAGDWDCYVQRMDANFQPVGTAITIDFTSSAWFRPRIAHRKNASASMVVVEVHSGSNPVKVSGRITDNAGTLITGQFDIAAVTVDSLVPDIGADPFPGIGYFTVVWEHAFSATDHDVYARQVTDAGVLRGTAPTIVQGNSINQRNPGISKSDGGASFADQRYAIVYQQNGGVFSWDIHGALMSWDGVLQPVNGSNTFPIETSAASTQLPNVSSPTLSAVTGKRVFLCVYENNSVNAGDIEMAAFDNNGTVLDRDNVVINEGAIVRLGWPQHFPSVDCDGTRFAVAYHENFNNSATDLDVRVTAVSYGSNQLFTMDSAAPGISSQPEFAAQIASRYASTATQDTGYATVNDRDTSSGFFIEGDRYDASITGLALVRSTSCGGGAFLSSSGDPLPGNTVSMTLSHSAPIAGFTAGTENSASLPGCNCIVGVNGVATFVGSTLAVPIPSTPDIIGARLSVQGWMLGAPGTSCLFDIHLTDTIDLIVR